jgi:hypothetical protein
MNVEDRLGELALSGLEQFGCSVSAACRIAKRPTALRVRVTAEVGRLGCQASRRRADLEQPNPSMPIAERSEATARHHPDRVRALFFGDFLLGQQKKVTRPPGRIPGAAFPTATRPPQAEPISDTRATP